MQMNEYPHLSQLQAGQQQRNMMMNMQQQQQQQPMMSSLQSQQQRLPTASSIGAPPGVGNTASRPLQNMSSLSQSTAQQQSQPLRTGAASSSIPSQQPNMQRQTSNQLNNVHPLTMNGQTIQAGQQGQKWPGQDGTMSGVPSNALFSMGGSGPSSMNAPAPSGNMTPHSHAHHPSAGGGAGSGVPGSGPGYHSSDMVNMLKSGYAHVATGMNTMPPISNDGPRFDMANDFPSLGDVVGKSSSHHSHQSSTSSQPAPSPTHNAPFAMQNEDFPSLQSTLQSPSSHIQQQQAQHQQQQQQQQPPQPQQQQLSSSDSQVDPNGDFPHLKDAMQRTVYGMQSQRRSGNGPVTQPQRTGPGPVQGQAPNYASSAQPLNGSNPASSRNSSTGSSSSSASSVIPPSTSSSTPPTPLSVSSTSTIPPSPMSSVSLPDGSRAPVTSTSASTSAAASATSGSAVGTAGMDRYGLTGLLSVIRMTDPDLNTLALGTDLTTLGLNLNSTEVLYATFAYPCLDAPTRRDPDYVLPYCYYMQPPALKTSHLSKFQLETLFYIFYNMPKDTLQVYAAKELYNRDWRYHKDMKLWFTRANDPKANPPDMSNGLIYFDCNLWERQIFRDIHLLAGAKFMTEEELAGLLQ